MSLNEQNYINHKNACALIRMCEGIEPMILSAPANDKREMILDVVKFAKIVSQALKVQTNSFSYIQTDNLQLEIKYGIENNENKALKLKIEKLEKQIKELLK